LAIDFLPYDRANQAHRTFQGCIARPIGGFQDIDAVAAPSADPTAEAFP
jgi:hypothetical protein